MKKSNINKLWTTELELEPGQNGPAPQTQPDDKEKSTDLHDGGVLVEMHLLNGHSGNLGEQDSPDGIHQGRIIANHVEFHLHAL